MINVKSIFPRQGQVAPSSTSTRGPVASPLSTPESSTSRRLSSPGLLPLRAAATAGSGALRNERPRLTQPVRSPAGVRACNHPGTAGATRDLLSRLAGMQGNNTDIIDAFNTLRQVLNQGGVPPDDPQWTTLFRTAYAFLDLTDEAAVNRLAAILQQRPEAEGAHPTPVTKLDLEQWLGSPADRQQALEETLPHWLPARQSQAEPGQSAADVIRSEVESVLARFPGSAADDMARLRSQAELVMAAKENPASRLPEGVDWLGGIFTSRRNSVVRRYTDFVRNGGSNRVLPAQLVQLLSSLNSIKQHRGDAVELLSELIEEDEEEDVADPAQRLMPSDARRAALVALVSQLPDVENPATQDKILRLVIRQVHGKPVVVHAAPDGRDTVAFTHEKTGGNMTPADKARVITALLPACRELNQESRQRSIKAAKDMLRMPTFPAEEAAGVAALLYQYHRSHAENAISDFLKKQLTLHLTRVPKSNLLSLCRCILQSSPWDGDAGPLAHKALTAAVLFGLPFGTSLDDKRRVIEMALGRDANLRRKVIAKLTDWASSTTSSSDVFGTRLAAARYLRFLGELDAHELTAAEQTRVGSALAKTVANVLRDAEQGRVGSHESMGYQALDLLRNFPADMKVADGRIPVSPSLKKPLSCLVSRCVSQLDAPRAATMLKHLIPTLANLQPENVQEISQHIARLLKQPEKPQVLGLSLIGNLSRNPGGHDDLLLELGQQAWQALDADHRSQALVDIFNRFNDSAGVGKGTVLKFVASCQGETYFIRAAAHLARRVLAAAPDADALALFDLGDAFGLPAEVPVASAPAKRNEEAPLIDI